MQGYVGNNGGKVTSSGLLGNMEQKRFVSSAVAFRGDANANTKGLLRRGKNEKNASRFRACSTTPLQSILRESRCEKMACDTESILPVFDFYLDTFNLRLL